MKKLLFSLLILSIINLIINTSSAYAQTPACTPVYGGGQGACVPIKKTTPAPTSVTFPQVPSTTKGGLPVLSSPNQTTNPATGPEALILIPLLSSGILGYLLRKKAL